MDNYQVMQIIETGLKAARQRLLEQAEVVLPIFEMSRIGNGFIVKYDTLDEFEKQIPIYPPHNPLTPPAVPTMQTVRRYRFKRAEVYCADAKAVKAAVDDALKLEEKVKLATAEGVLSDSSDNLIAAG